MDIIGLLGTGVPLWLMCIWLFLLNPAIEALSEPTAESSPQYVWFYKFANTLAGNFQEAMKHKTKPPVE